jgi:predicted 3-demethylubiquinone-9 3-methyltransferase (glyoxalase superfamily)
MGTILSSSQKITPFLWFNDQAEDAMNFYTSIFKNSKIESVRRYGRSGPGKEGTVMTCSFILDGQRFMVLNGGPHFTFNPAISFFVDCDTQEEIDYYWQKLSEEGKEVKCGWLTDKFGVSWQIVPSILGKMLGDADKAKAERVTAAMLKMIKLDIEILAEAYEE